MIDTFITFFTRHPRVVSWISGLWNPKSPRYTDVQTFLGDGRLWFFPQALQKSTVFDALVGHIQNALDMQGLQSAALQLLRRVLLRNKVLTAAVYQCIDACLGGETWLDLPFGGTQDHQNVQYLPIRGTKVHQYWNWKILDQCYSISVGQRYQKPTRQLLIIFQSRIFPFFPQRLEIRLMEEILHQLKGILSHYLQGFLHPRWCRISSINSMDWILWKMVFHSQFCFERHVLQTKPSQLSSFFALVKGKAA